MLQIFCFHREAAKKIKFFLVARPLRPYPPPASLVATFFGEHFFVRATKKLNFFFAAYRKNIPKKPQHSRKNGNKHICQFKTAPSIQIQRVLHKTTMMDFNLIQSKVCLTLIVLGGKILSSLGVGKQLTRSIGGVLESCGIFFTPMLLGFNFRKTVRFQGVL